MTTYELRSLKLSELPLLPASMHKLQRSVGLKQPDLEESFQSTYGSSLCSSGRSLAKWEVQLQLCNLEPQAVVQVQKPCLSDNLAWLLVMLACCWAESAGVVLLEKAGSWTECTGWFGCGVKCWSKGSDHGFIYTTVFTSTQTEFSDCCINMLENSSNRKQCCLNYFFKLSINSEAAFCFHQFHAWSREPPLSNSGFSHGAGKAAAEGDEDEEVGGACGCWRQRLCGGV